MSRPKVISPEVRSELDRLLKCAQRAHTTQDNATETSCLLRWADLYRSARGQSSPTPKIVLTERQAASHRTVQETPMWRLRQKLSPLVAIVRVEEVRFRNRSGHENNYWIEHLSCGHTQNYSVTLDYPGISKRRRCKPCGEAALIAAGYIGDLARDHEPVAPQSTATLTRTVPAGDTTQFTFSVKPAPAEPVKPRVIAMQKPVTPATGIPPDSSAAVLATADRRNRG
jgi:hypothetical protein